MSAAETNIITDAIPARSLPLKLGVGIEIILPAEEDKVAEDREDSKDVDMLGEDEDGET